MQQAHIGGAACVLKVRQPGATTFVVVGAGKGVGITEERPPRPDGARAWTKLEGFRVAWLRDDAVGLARDRGSGPTGPGLSTPAAERALIAARAPLAPVLGADAWTGDEGAAREEERDAWLARGAAIAGGVARDALVAKRAAAARAIKRGVQRLERRAEAVRGDLAKMRDAEAIAQQLPWLVAAASKAPRGAKELEVTDWSTGEARAVVVPLDPAKPARAQVEAMFQRARRLKHGAQVAEERLAQTERTLAALAPIAARVAAAEDAEAIDAALAEARALAPKDVKLEATTARPRAERALRGRNQETSGARARGQERAPPFRTFHARGGARLLVGRGAAHNDTLTFQVARPHDTWLHAKDRAGAHVIVPLAKGHSCPPDVLADAAHLAAHFSDARDEAVVDVQYAERRHLRKPRGSAPGFVVVDREKVIAVRIDAAVMRALLESEEA